MCLTGQTLVGTTGGSTQFTMSCQATGVFTAVSSFLQYMVDPLPSAETGVFNDVVTYILRRGDDLGSTWNECQCLIGPHWSVD